MYYRGLKHTITIPRGQRKGSLERTRTCASRLPNHLPSSQESGRYCEMLIKHEEIKNWPHDVGPTRAPLPQPKFQK